MTTALSPTAPANEGTKNWVSDVADLYAKGYITPNITQDTDRDEQMANGGFGVTYSWCAWNQPRLCSDDVLLCFQPGC